MTEATPALVVEDMHKSFGALEVLKGVSLTAHEGDVISRALHEYLRDTFELPLER